ncbi:MAG: metallophosphoesterase [Candidatus Staskawiczbacteria bacterium]|jgi:hypothetical protein
MKITIISDTHDNLTVAKKVIEWSNKEGITLILHCGDISSRETINEMINSFKGDIRFVHGNADINLTGIPDTDEVKIGNKNIAFTHFPELAKGLAESGKYDLVFYGHTHKPWEERIGKCRMINPGEAAGIFNKRTFAVYDSDSDKLELKMIDLL